MSPFRLRLFLGVLLLALAVSLWLVYKVLGPAPFSPAEGGLIRLGEGGGGPTVVEFSSFSCPHCRRYWATVFPRIYQEHVVPGKVGYVVRLVSWDEGGSLMARLSYCAYREGGEEAFLGLREGFISLYLTGQDPEILLRRLMEAGLVSRDLLTCAEGEWARDQERADREAAVRLSLGGTPTFFVGRTRLLGFRTYEELVQVIGP